MSKTKIISAVSIICTLFIIMVIYTYLNTQNKIKRIAIHTEKVYGNIEFSGKVDSIIKIRRGGRTYGLMCIELDYSNVESFYRFDKYTTLKIKNNKAVLPTGFIGEHPTARNDFLFKTKYINVNKDGNKKYVFYTSNDSLVENWDFGNNNLIEEDLIRCGY